MTSSALDVIYTDNHLIAVIKPAGLLTQTDSTGATSLMEETRRWIKNEYNKTGNVFLGLVHRLDRNVSGIVLFARTSKAASRLSKQFREGMPKKIYRAIILGKPKEKKATLVHYLRKEKSRKTTVFSKKTNASKYSELSYEVIKSLEKNSLIEVTLSTGRFHQIRSQMAFIGHPIMGDKKYGACKTLPNYGIALYACKLTFNHPISNQKITLTTTEPTSWAQLKV